MKKKVLFGIGIVMIIILAIATYKYNPIYSKYKKKQIIKNNIEFLNGEINDMISIDDIEIYNRLMLPLEEINRYDITMIIDKYIELVLERMKNNGVKDKKHNSISDIRSIGKMNLSFGEGITMRYDDNIQYYIDDIGNEYTKDNIILELKNILDYEEQNEKIKWMVNDTKEKNIELPFNCYLKYIPCYWELDNEIKEIKDIEYMKKFDIDKYHSSVLVSYITNDDIIRTKETAIDKTEKNGKVYYSCFSYDVLTKDDAKRNIFAKIELRSHDIDRIKEEHRKEIEAYENRTMREEMEAGLR